MKATFSPHKLIWLVIASLLVSCSGPTPPPPTTAPTGAPSPTTLPTVTPTLSPTATQPAPSTTPPPTPTAKPTTPPARTTGVCPEVLETQAGTNFLAADLKLGASGLKAEWFVPPSTFNLPTQVFYTPQGDYLVNAGRSSKLLRVSRDGKASTFATGVNGTAGATDPQGNLYIYLSPGGGIQKITPQGQVSQVVKSEKISTSCSSGFGRGPDGNFYISYNSCQPREATLLRITPGGVITTVAEKQPLMLAFITTPDGRFIGGAEDATLYEISLKDYSLKRIAKVNSRYGLAESGLAIDEAGNIYLSSGTRFLNGEVHKISPDGSASLLAAIPGNGISGLAWDAQSKEVLGVQYILGAMLAVGQNGQVRTLVPGSGLASPIALSFSPCGELLVSNDDGGNMSMVSPSGKVSMLANYNSYSGPISYLLAAANGDIYASEGAPGLPHRLVMLKAGESAVRVLPTSPLTSPSGLLRQADGSLITAETIKGQITQVNPDGSTRALYSGLVFPAALARDTRGNLYTTTGGTVFSSALPAPFTADVIIRLLPNGQTQPLANLAGVAQLAGSPSGELVAAAMSGQVVSYAPDGSRVVLLDRAREQGIPQPLGAAFDLAGRLYISDATLNGILRISGFPAGSLTGSVQDQAGKPLPGALVRAWRELPAVSGGVISAGVDGSFSLAAAPGDYQVAVFCRSKALAQTTAQVAAGAAAKVTLVVKDAACLLEK